jgi:Zn-dependent protease with chaperone function
MSVAIALIFGTALVAVVVVVQLIWALLILIPLYVYFALVIYLVLRSRRRQAEADAFLAREAERQRSLNEQEFRAWKAAADGARRNADKRNRMLRQFDANRNPSEK